jgi:metal-sulfur cluster biosynthetic enzyme
MAVMSHGQSDTVTPEKVREALRLVIDPELGLNVVDLGLVYRVDVEDGQVRVAMTMTTPACPLGQSLSEQAEATIWQTVPGLKSVALDLVWDPPWTPSMMSEAAKQQLGWSE